MPIKIPDHLPTAEILKSENIFVMTESCAAHEDIRPLKIVILNLMPTKVETETQLLRLLGNSPFQVDITLLYPRTHLCKNTPQEYLLRFYNTFENIQDERFDGMVITGAPIEQLPFEEVTYWKELCHIMDWSLQQVSSTFHICWGAQAALYHHYGVPKYPLGKKIFGVFQHRVNCSNARLLQGFDDVFYAPHSRHTEVRREDILKVPALELLSESEEAGVYIVGAKNGKQFFVTGHSEYDALTLKSEHERDIKNGQTVELPCNYYPDNDPSKKPVVVWRSHASLIFNNWLNYYVYKGGKQEC